MNIDHNAIFRKLLQFQNNPQVRSPVKKLINNFYAQAKDLNKVSNSEIICNKKVYTGFRCITCETMETDGSSRSRSNPSHLGHLRGVLRNRQAPGPQLHSDPELRQRLLRLRQPRLDQALFLLLQARRALRREPDSFKRKPGPVRRLLFRRDPAVSVQESGQVRLLHLRRAGACVEKSQVPVLRVQRAYPRSFEEGPSNQFPAKSHSEDPKHKTTDRRLESLLLRPN